MPWLLNIVYLFLLTLASPVLLYRSFALSKYREGWSEKFLGWLPLRQSERPCVWFHAVSVGEVLQLNSVLSQLENSHPDYEFVISTTTSTGLAVAKEKYPQHRVCYFPLDFSWSVRNALRRIRPSAAILVELELWPNFITAVDRRGIPLGLINGRISENSYRGYCRIRPLMKRLLHRFTLIAAQNECFANRLIDLGASAATVETTGSIKFDGVELDRTNQRTEKLRKLFQIDEDETVFVAGSTQAPEEQIAIETWLVLCEQHPKLRLILVPRHQERFEEVATLVKQIELPLIRRSGLCDSDEGDSKKTFYDGSTVDEDIASGSKLEATSASKTDSVISNNDLSHRSPVILLDTLGELGACWGLADIAFVGGSLTNRGGQNMLEPAAYGAAVLFGPNTRNFKQIVNLLLAHQAAAVVLDRADLTRTVDQLLNQPDIARAQGERARDFVLSQQGATSRTVSLIVKRLLQSNESKPSNIDADAA